MRFIFIFCTLLFSISTFAQSRETYPIFPACENVTVSESQNCFETNLQKMLFENYKEPKVVIDQNYTGVATVIFEVNKQGEFQVNYIDAKFADLKEAIQEAFDLLPRIEPAKYNGVPTYFQLRLPLRIPLTQNYRPASKTDVIIAPAQKDIVREYDDIVTTDYQNQQFESNLSIPFSHEVYSRFDREMNLIGTNSHTASKPYKFKQVQPYYDIAAFNENLFFQKESWFGRKFWNENTARVSGDNYWFTFDIAADLQLGRDFEMDFTTYNNSRIGVFQGGIGKRFTFYTAVFESQGKFAGYFNDFAREIGREGTSLATIPGRGIAESFRGSAFDYPVAEAYINFEATDFLDLELGTGNNFIGDGYRSLLLSDNASPNAYVKMNTTFWKFKLTNIWSTPRNLNNLTDGGSYETKYMSTHYLSYNVTKRFTLGLFESILFESDGNRGYDWNFINPIIFYNMAEYGTGTRAGKSLLGLTYKYKWSNNFNMYGQFLVDELALGDVAAMDKSWRNKFGFQTGFKYYDAFKVKDLYLQFEYNQVRPYTYSHNTLSLHYTHNNQSMAHLWGANFREFILLARYRKDRWYGHTKFIFGERGFEPNADSDPFYGSDLFGDERVRVGDNNINIGQGNRAHSLFGELEVGYLVNPTTNLKVYLSLIHRDFSIAQNNERNFDRTTTWINFGFRTDLFNWYFDY